MDPAMLGTLGNVVIPLVASGQAAQIAKDGAPMVVQAAGRLLGLGDEERAALAGGKIPWWLWAVGGVAAGYVLGVKMQKRYPASAVPNFLRKKTR